MSIDWLHLVLVGVLILTYLDRVYYKDIVTEEIERMEELADDTEAEE